MKNMTKVEEKQFKLDNAIDNLVSDICERAEEERSNASISDDNDIFCLHDTLRMYYDYTGKATKCKSVQAVKELRKRACRR